MLGLDQVPVSPCRVGIGHHDVAIKDAAIFQPHATSRSAFDKDFVDFGVAFNGAALTFNQ